MNVSRWISSMAAVLALGAACSSDATGGGTQAGTLTLRLITPHADDGAMTFEVSGPAIDNATSISASLRLFTRRAGGGTVAGVVVGAVANGPVVALQVPDVGAAASYTARVLEVADRQDALRASLSGYAITVTP
ncbi:MAG TPA: hypothetical protein VFU41_02295 [Gemmatimonadales bacterium]|nr:hypothetical protein [Gemmatimonadales bacterium]